MMTFRYILFLLTCFHILGLVIFLKGFLLTRQTLDQRGSLYDAWDRFPLDGDNLSTSSLPLTTSPPPFQRVVVVVIDALRFDFMIPDDTDKPYRNRLPIIDQLYTTRRDHTLLFQFRADPPTTTMQRIKGLMTGSLPTFIDAGSNFASSSVQEDHLLFHMAAQYPALYFMGDDTWQHLFPNALTPERTFASDSFKMFDLHTVDNRIQAQLWPLLHNDDWQVVITHFLGVDHCGHTYGPDHMNMAGKLDEMNTVLTRLVDKHVDQDTLLVVMGDHGMSVEGDHGGESVEELMSGLLLYSGRPLVTTSAYFDDLIRRMHQARTSILGYDTNKITDRLHYNASAYPIVPQIHLVPTLAYLLGLPIPFGNLGGLIPDILLQPSLKASSTQDKKENQLDSLLHMAQQFRMNALQVYDYLVTYGLETHHIGFTEHSLAPLIQQLVKADTALEQALGLIKDKGKYEQLVGQLESAIMGYDKFLSSTIKYCEAIWAQFDVGCMVVGMAVLGLTTITGVLLWICHSDWSQLGKADTFKRVVFSFWTAGLLGVALFGSSSLFDKMGWMDGCVCVLGLVMTAGLIYNTLQQMTLTGFTTIDYDGWVLLVAATLQALTLGSNSFVVWEDRGTRFTATTLCVGWFVRIGQHLDGNTNKRQWIQRLSRPFLVMLWFRLGGFIGQCREEQYPHCSYIDIGLLKQLNGDVVIWWTTATLVCILGLVLALHTIWMFGHTYSRLLSVVYGLCVLVVTIRIVDDVYQTVFDRGSEFQKVIGIYLPRFVYAATVCGTLYLWQVRGSLRKHQVCLSYICLWSTVLALLQRPLGGLVVLLCPYVVHVLALNDDGIMLRLALIHTLGHHLFFVTGHQATFTSLPWHAAFIGFDDMYYYIGATLVTLSTLTGYVLSWIGTWMILSDRRDGDNQVYFMFMMLLQCIPTFLSSIFVFILRRHLMTWKIFAPRFLLQALLVGGTFMAHLIFQSWW
ncbi:hypothetical protein BC941DRAFT_408055 [Chlamydoabsidia padenii]|nr:hypothetical protein BC941DRAFT_408055 [Chlamydoabsidia padenii]